MLAGEAHMTHMTNPFVNEASRLGGRVLRSQLACFESQWN
jgi:hypothetical protein